jgi:hypothetical protein
MGRERAIMTVLVVSIIINIALLSFVFLNNESLSHNEKKSDVRDKWESDIKDKEIDIGFFQLGEFALTEGETLINGRYSFNYSTAGWSISVMDLEDDRLVCHFWHLEEGAIYGINGFKMNVTSMVDYNITINFTQYSETDYLGKAVYFKDLESKIIGFGGNESIIYQHYYPGNKTVEIRVMTPQENYSVWLPPVTKTDIGFIKLWQRHGGALECT